MSAGRDEDIKRGCSAVNLEMNNQGRTRRRKNTARRCFYSLILIKLERASWNESRVRECSKWSSAAARDRVESRVAAANPRPPRGLVSCKGAVELPFGGGVEC